MIYFISFHRNQKRSLFNLIIYFFVSLIYIFEISLLVPKIQAGTLKIDNINELTTDNGVFIENILIKDGKIGINTTSNYSGSAIHVKGILTLDDRGDSWSTLQFLNSSNNNKRWQQSHNESSNNLEFYGHNGSSWKMVMALTDSGKIGIGTSSPKSILEITGNHLMLLIQVLEYLLLQVRMIHYHNNSILHGIGQILV